MSVKRNAEKCVAREQNLSLLAAGLLPEVDHADVKRHLNGCAACRELLRELTVVAHDIAELQGPATQAAPSRQLRVRWTREILSASPVQPEMSLAGKIASLLHAWISAHRPATAGLAAVWVLIGFFHFTAPNIPQVATNRPPLTTREIMMVLRGPSAELYEVLETPATKSVPVLKPRGEAPAHKDAV
jgi:anti-sigma factor RsiW